MGLEAMITESLLESAPPGATNHSSDHQPVISTGLEPQVSSMMQPPMLHVIPASPIKGQSSYTSDGVTTIILPCSPTTPSQLDELQLKWPSSATSKADADGDVDEELEVLSTLQEDLSVLSNKSADVTKKRKKLSDAETLVRLSC